MRRLRLKHRRPPQSERSGRLRTYGHIISSSQANHAQDSHTRTSDVYFTIIEFDTCGNVWRCMLVIYYACT